MVSPRDGIFAVSVLLALAASSVSAIVLVELKNNCGFEVELHDGVTIINRQQMIPPGGLAYREIAKNSSYAFRHTDSIHATLAEFSYRYQDYFDFVLYDISIIPQGPSSGKFPYCSSLDDCKWLRGGVGFNIAMQIKPTSYLDSKCKVLTCMKDGCNDAFQFPMDDVKAHACSGSADFEVTFCPAADE